MSLRAGRLSWSLAAGAVSLLWGCIWYSGPVESRVRPPSVPESAVWSGGSDGGAWIACNQVSDAPRRWECATFDTRTGEIVSFGRYKWIGEGVEPDGELVFTGAPGGLGFRLERGKLAPIGKHYASLFGGERLVEIFPEDYQEWPYAERTEKYVEPGDLEEFTKRFQ